MRQAIEVVCRATLLGLALYALDVSAQDIKLWLDRMNRAVDELSYEGTFVRVLDGNAETLHIVHRNVDGMIGERISSLDGTGREILRKGQQVRCVLPDRQLVLLEAPRGPSSPLSSALPNYSEALEAHYELKTFRKGQVARRDTQIVVINPRDELRYGYVLWLDQETAMPLKSQVRDETGSVVEQILFTEFETFDSIRDSAVESQTDTSGFTRVEPHDYVAASGHEIGWRSSGLPSGFELSGAKRSAMAGNDKLVEHLIYSDGLATVSVFVADASTDVAEGFSRFGSTNAYSLTLRGRKITAMGEVPRHTLQRIATSLDHR